MRPSDAVPLFIPQCFISGALCRPDLLDCLSCSPDVCGSSVVESALYCAALFGEEHFYLALCSVLWLIDILSVELIRVVPGKCFMVHLL